VAEVLLTHSYHLPYDRKQVKKMQPYPPLGTLYAAGLLREEGIATAVFDAMLEQPEAGFRESLRVHRPKVVAIYEDDFNFLTKMCLTRMRQLAFEMIEIGRRAGARVIVHGSDATDHTAEYLRHGCEYVLTGESEYSLLELTRDLLAGRASAGVPGVWSLAQENAHRGNKPLGGNGHHQPKPLPLPARDLLDLAKYRAAWTQSHGYFSLNLIASRGCPFRCNWCAKPIFGDSYQLRPPDDVATEMQLLRNAFAADHLWFADDIFALNRRWIQDFARAVEARACAVPFKIQARADLLTAETVRALKRAGCREVWMGVESASQKVLDAMDKGLRVEEVVSACHHLQSEGILACYFLQFGYPGENWEDIQKTIALVRETRPDDIGVSFSYPLPNTRFYARVQQQLGAKRNWSDSEDLCVMFRGAYTDLFYRAIRNALHAEVEGWKTNLASSTERTCAELWKEVAALEPTCRNADATEFLPEDAGCEVFPVAESAPFVQLRTLNASVGEG